ncbi:MAG: hypothetical protein GY945_08030 [Rhodobacteraceae bacterium]|nr:hypothetical protein [Paracoccaceae bacterium]
MRQWCRQEAIPYGETISLAQGWRLAQGWYHDRLAPDFRRKTGPEAQQFFTELGLTSSFWQLPGGSEQ